MSADSASQIKEIGFSNVDVSKLGLPDQRLVTVLDTEQAFVAGRGKYVFLGAPTKNDYKFAASWTTESFYRNLTCFISIYDARSGKIVSKRFPFTSSTTLSQSYFPDSKDDPDWWCAKVNAVKFVSSGNNLMILIVAEGHFQKPKILPPLTPEHFPERFELYYVFDIDVDKMKIEPDLAGYKAINSSQDGLLGKNINQGRFVGVDGLYDFLRSKSVIR